MPDQIHTLGLMTVYTMWH